MHNNGKYEYRGNGDYRNMFGSLEEHLNYVNCVRFPDPEAEGCQLDLLVLRGKHKFKTLINPLTTD